jgi:hypothetical protein
VFRAFSVHRIASASLLSSTLLGCLDDRGLALPDKETNVDAAAPTIGRLSLNLETDSAVVGTIAIRVNRLDSDQVVGDESFVMEQELAAPRPGDVGQRVALSETIAPGDYRVRIRGVTSHAQVCVGLTDFTVDGGDTQIVPIAVSCDVRSLEVGTAKVTVVDQNDNEVVSSIVPVSRNLDTSSFQTLPPGTYVVWITATASDQTPCVGSADLVISPSSVTKLDIDVICKN